MNSAQAIVLFNWKAGVSGERSRTILAEVAAWPAVDDAGPLAGDSPVETLRRACIATLRPEADPAAVVDRLRALREVESASAPTPRRLVA